MTNSNAVELTISDVKNFKSCRQLWDYKSELRQGLVPNLRAIHFAFGDLFHQALEQFYQGEKDPAKWFEDEARNLLNTVDRSSTAHYEDLVETIEIGAPILRAYVRWARNNDDFRVVSTEQRMTVRLNDKVPGKFFSFKYDALVSRGGKLWIHDYKTAKQLPTNFDWLVMDDQAVAYQAAFELATGKKIEGVMFTFIRKYKPAVPQMLISGELTKRKNIVTTQEVYLDTIKSFGLDINNYRDILETIEENEGNNFFSRGYARASEKAKQLKLDELRELATLMADPDVFIYSAPERMKCSNCDFHEPCLLRHNGANDAALLATAYKKGEPR